MNLKKDKKYKFKVGDIIKTKRNDVVVIEQTLIKDKKSDTTKGYLLKCPKHNYSFIKTEEVVNSGKGSCPICSNRLIIPEINSLWATDRWAVKYFKNEDDSKLYSRQSDKKVDIKCPSCGFEKQMQISKLTYRGFNCPTCGKGASRNERIIHNLLSQLKINYKHEFRLLGEEYKSKRYDFYIENLNCIIETHGMQHYRDECYSYMKGGKNFEQQIANDREKEQIAKEFGIKYYIVIDCSSGSLEKIKNNILNSEMKDLLDIENLDWGEIFSRSCSSITFEIANLSKEGFTPKEISEKIHMCTSAIWKHLKNAKEIGFL